MRLGVKIIKKQGDDRILTRRASVCDLDSGELLPVSELEIAMHADSVVTARMTVDIASMEFEEVEN